MAPFVLAPFLVRVFARHSGFCAFYLSTEAATLAEQLVPESIFWYSFSGASQIKPGRSYYCLTAIAQKEAKGYLAGYDTFAHLGPYSTRVSGIEAMLLM